MDKIQLGLTYSVSKNKEGIGTDKPKFGGLEVKTRIANGVFKNKTEAKGGENKTQSSGLLDKTLAEKLAKDLTKVLIKTLTEKLAMELAEMVANVTV